MQMSAAKDVYIQQCIEAFEASSEYADTQKAAHKYMRRRLYEDLGVKNDSVAGMLTVFAQLDDAADFLECLPWSNEDGTSAEIAVNARSGIRFLRQLAEDTSAQMRADGHRWYEEVVEEAEKEWALRN
jgi:hypothetical protein